MVCADIDSTYEELLEIFRAERFTRIPVYEGDGDNMVGVINMKDLLLFHPAKEFHIRDIMREPYFTYEYKKTSELMVEMRKDSVNFTIVLDEYGATVGMITLEDLLEEIVGDIWDEKDVVENEVVTRPDGGYELDGAMTLSDFLELLDWNEDALDDADSTTVGGWTLERFGTFPKPGDSFRYENLTVTVLAMDGRRVERVLVQPDPDADKDKDA